MSLSFLDDALGIAAGAAGIAGLFSGGQAKLHGWQERGMKSGALNLQNIAGQLQNPNDPQFMANVAQEEGDIRSGVQSGIRELMTADQRQRARGLSGLLSPERRDEGIASATATAFEQARNEAKNRVRAYLISAANVNAQLLGGVPAQPMGGGVNNQMLGLAGAFDLARAAIGGGQQQPLNGGRSPGSGGYNVNLNFGGQGSMGLPSRRGYSG
jgi:hypothetical protein